jgi:hypothetical protein
VWLRRWKDLICAKLNVVFRGVSSEEWAGRAFLNPSGVISGHRCFRQTRELLSPSRQEPPLRRSGPRRRVRFSGSGLNIYDPTTAVPNPVYNAAKATSDLDLC